MMPRPSRASGREAGNADSVDGTAKQERVEVAPAGEHFKLAHDRASRIDLPRPPSPDIPRALPAFTGLSKSAVVDTILGSLRQWLPVSGKRSRELKRVEAWALFRFTGFGTRKFAGLLTTVEELAEAVRSVRALCEKERAWWRAIWNAECSLRWSLAAAPWRESISQGSRRNPPFTLRQVESLAEPADAGRPVSDIPVPFNPRSSLSPDASFRPVRTTGASAAEARDAASPTTVPFYSKPLLSRVSHAFSAAALHFVY